MDYHTLLSRAWHVTFQYRILWVFGFVLAFFGASRSSRISPFDLAGASFNSANPFFLFEANAAVLIGLGVLAVGWFVAGNVLRPVAATALISLEQHLAEGGKVTFKTGWQFGWSRRAWRIFLIEIIVRLSSSLIFGVALLCALSPLLLFLLDSGPAQLIAWVGGFGLFCVWLLFIGLSNLLITPFIEISRRYVVLADIGTIDSLRHAYRLVRQKTPSFMGATGLMLAFNIGWYIVSSIFSTALSFVFLLSQIGQSSLADDGWAWLSMVIWLVIYLIGLLALTVWAFLTGLLLIYQLTFWTAFFRELNLTAY